MIEVTLADIGRMVVYRGFGVHVEEGVVTSFNDKYVFVRYANTSTSKATHRGRLEWATVKENLNA